MPRKIAYPGKLVIYQINEEDATEINRRRSDAIIHNANNAHSGIQVYVGNDVYPGDLFPAIIIRVWQGPEFNSANLKVLLDGNDTWWVQSRTRGKQPGQWRWLGVV